MFISFFWKIQVLYKRFWAFSLGPGRFGERREAGRNHFHLSWYLLVPGVTSYGQKPWGDFFFTEHGMMPFLLDYLFCSSAILVMYFSFVFNSSNLSSGIVRSSRYLVSNGRHFSNGGFFRQLGNYNLAHVFFSAFNHNA